MTGLATNLEAEFRDTNFERRFRLEPLLDYAVSDVREGLRHGVLPESTLWWH